MNDFRGADTLLTQGVSAQTRSLGRVRNSKAVSGLSAALGAVSGLGPCGPHGTIGSEPSSRFAK